MSEPPNRNGAPVKAAQGEDGSSRPRSSLAALRDKVPEEDRARFDALVEEWQLDQPGAALSLGWIEMLALILRRDDPREKLSEHVQRLDLVLTDFQRSRPTMSALLLAIVFLLGLLLGVLVDQSDLVSRIGRTIHR